MKARKSCRPTSSARGRARPARSSGRGVVEHPRRRAAATAGRAARGTRSGARRRRGGRRSPGRVGHARGRRGRPAAGRPGPRSMRAAGRSLPVATLGDLPGRVHAGVGAPGDGHLDRARAAASRGRRAASPRRCGARLGRPSPRTPRRRTPGPGGGPARPEPPPLARGGRRDVLGELQEHHRRRVTLARAELQRAGVAALDVAEGRPDHVEEVVRDRPCCAGARSPGAGSAGCSAWRG